MISAQKARKRPSDRRQTETDKTPLATPQPFPAPVGGWVDGIRGQNTARVLENGFPLTTTVRVRSGCAQAAFITDPVVSMFTYETAAAEKIFAASATDVYDISALNPLSAPTADITGQTGGYYVSAQLGTVGGDYMYIVNGADNAQLFDGTTWTQITGVSSPAMTGVDTSNLSYVWVFKNRFWFIEKDTNKVWYLPVDSISGTLTDFSLEGVFQEGGSLLFGASWSSDAGDGMDDRQVFMSTTGEVAVYQGSDPSDATKWSMVGLYSIQEAMGPKAHIRAGGDVLIATKAGLIPMSAVVAKDPEALGLNSVSSDILASWQSQTNASSSATPWELIKWPREQMLFASLPHDTDDNYVANLNTGAWAKYTGWDAQALGVFNTLLYFGSADGYIYAAESGGSDNGSAYEFRMSMSPTDLGGGAHIKTVSAMQATFLATTEIIPKLSVSTDYDVNFPSAPTVSESVGGSEGWDVGLWDTAVWDGSSDVEIKPVYRTRWTSVAGNGFAVAPQIQITLGGTGSHDAELASIDILYSVGAAVV